MFIWGNFHPCCRDLGWKNRRPREPQARPLVDARLPQKPRRGPYSQKLVSQILINSRFSVSKHSFKKNLLDMITMHTKLLHFLIFFSIVWDYSILPVTIPDPAPLPIIWPRQVRPFGFWGGNCPRRACPWLVDCLSLSRGTFSSPEPSVSFGHVIKKKKKQVALGTRMPGVRKEGKTEKTIVGCIFCLHVGGSITGRL